MFTSSLSLSRFLRCNSIFQYCIDCETFWLAEIYVADRRMASESLALICFESLKGFPAASVEGHIETILFLEAAKETTQQIGIIFRKEEHRPILIGWSRVLIAASMCDLNLKPQLDSIYQTAHNLRREVHCT